MNSDKNSRWVSLYEVLEKQKYFDDPGDSDISKYISMLIHSVASYSVDEEGGYAEGKDLTTLHEKLKSEEIRELIRTEGYRTKICDFWKKVFFDSSDVKHFDKDFSGNYLSWASMDYWTAEEAAWLLSGYDPEDGGYGRSDPQHSYELEDTIDRYMSLLRRGGKSGVIKRLTKEECLDPKSVLEWADKKEIEVPYKLRIAMELYYGSGKSSIGRVSTKPDEDKPPSELSGKESPNLGSRAETTYLNIIGALLEVILSGDLEIQRHPDFNNQSELITHLGHYEMPGLSKSTLENKFAKAKRLINQVTD